jgi:hypothetical protein
MKTKKLWTILILLLVAGAALFGWSQIRRGFSARATPSRIEMMAARGARSLAIPSSPFRRKINQDTTAREDFQLR